MTKKETQSEIWVYERLRDISEEKLDTLNHQLRDLCEAEKLELGHGDFGYVWDEGEKEKPSRFVVTNHKGGLYWSRHSGLPSLIPLVHLTEHKYTILGNIFDLLKEWGEPFEEYLKNNSAMGIQIDDDHIMFFACTGGKGCNKENDSCYYQIESAERFWRSLGHAIVELKRKKN